nr:uncharacterized protein LOC113801061 [Penaeus vannamei]
MQPLIVVALDLNPLSARSPQPYSSSREPLRQPDREPYSHPLSARSQIGALNQPYSPTVVSPNLTHCQPDREPLIQPYSPTVSQIPIVEPLIQPYSPTVSQIVSPNPTLLTTVSRSGALNPTLLTTVSQIVSPTLLTLSARSFNQPYSPTVSSALNPTLLTTSPDREPPTLLTHCQPDPLNPTLLTTVSQIP